MDFGEKGEKFMIKSSIIQNFDSKHGKLGSVCDIVKKFLSMSQEKYLRCMKLQYQKFTFALHLILMTSRLNN